MVSHMKTTVEISDPVLNKAKQLAAAEGTTLKALLEEALRRVIDDHEQRGDFRLRSASFRGSGMRPEVREGGWARVRELAYDGRGT